MSRQDEATALAWADFCRRIAALGDQVQAEAPTPAAAAEGIHHLANQVACWLTYAIGHTDPAHPALFRSSDPVYQWGGPNADQVARRAAIDGTGSYRLVGSMGTCEEFVLQCKAGTAQSGGAGVAREVSASSLGLGPGDPIDVLLRAEPAEGAWVELPPDTAFVHIRDYYFDWQSGDPATFVLERVDDPADPKPERTSERVAAMLADAAGEIEHSFAFWSGYQERMLGDQVSNTFTVPGGSAGGVQAITYAHAGVVLAPDEALVVELEGDAAPLWDVQLYNRPWYEALDFAYRSTSTNHRMAQRNADGSVSVVIAARDTGAANWLDTEGRAAVLATVRWWNASSPPTVRARVVPVSDVSGPVGPAQRRAQIRGAPSTPPGDIAPELRPVTEIATGSLWGQFGILGGAMRSSRLAIAGAGLAIGVGLSAAACTPATSSITQRHVGLLRLAHGATFNITQSNNWSGYNQGMLEKGKSFSSISGTWTVPTASANKAKEAEYSATWVGIGGGCLNTACSVTDNSLIQAGTEQDVAANGKKTYYAWYELIPAPSTQVSLPVAPGNRVSVAIKQSAPGVWAIAIRNLSTGKSWSTTTPYPSTMATAEWIEETPLLIGSGGSGISALPRLSAVHFTGSTANGVAAGLAPAERMQLVDSSGHVLATPSNPNKAKTAFNDCTYATTCAVPAG